LILHIYLQCLNYIIVGYRSVINTRLDTVFKIYCSHLQRYDPCFSDLFNFKNTTASV